MRTLPIYPEIPKLAIQTSVLLERNSGCTRCKHFAGVRNVCLPAVGTPGGVLVVTDAPRTEEDNSGKPLQGPSGSIVRYAVRKYYKGPFAMDHALKCRPGERAVLEAHINKCRPYLAQTVEEVKPERIFALGKWAISALLGRSVSPMSARRGFAWMTSLPGSDVSPLLAPSITPVPVFLGFDPGLAMRNDFVKRWLEQDLKWMCEVDPTTMRDTTQKYWGARAKIVETMEDAHLAASEMRANGPFSVDCETAGKMFEDGSTQDEPKFRIVSIATHARDTLDPWVWDEEALGNPSIIEFLWDLLEDPNALKGNQNIHYDQHAFWSHAKIAVNGICFDTRFQRRLLNAEAAADLETQQELIGLGGGKNEVSLAKKEIVKQCRKKERKGQPAIELKDLAHVGPPDLVNAIRLAKDKSDKYVYGLLPKDLRIRYVALDTLTTSLVAERQKKQLESEPAIKAAWDDLVLPAILAIQKVEQTGIPVDREAVVAFDTRLQAIQEKNIEELKRMSAQYMDDFNPDSNPQVAKLLFIHLGLKAFKFSKKTKRPSTDAEVLEALEHRHPIAKVLWAYRKTQKLIGTYAAGLLKHIRPNGRIHCTINADGATSGRTSSADPNLQNVPRSDPDHPDTALARNIFWAGDPDYVFIQFDYSQLELRVAAMLSLDLEMKAIFLSGEDYHKRTAMMVSKVAWGIEPEDVGKEHRSQSKAINFGVLYGMTIETLATNLGIPVIQAERIYKAIMGKFRRLDRWMKSQVAEARKTGYVWTWWAGKKFRRRPLWRVADKDPKSASRAKNGSGNTPIQGSSSDFLIKSMIMVLAMLKKYGLEHEVEVNLPIHDALLMRVKRVHVPFIINKVKLIMEGHPNCGPTPEDGIPVPLVADVEMGWRFGQMAKVKEVEGELFIVKDGPKDPATGKRPEIYTPWEEEIDSQIPNDMRIPL